MRGEHSHQRLMWVRAAGIRISATTDWLPNAGIDQDQANGSILQPGRPQENIRNCLNPNPIRAGR